jgi:hypothetical protein
VVSNTARMRRRRATGKARYAREEKGIRSSGHTALDSLYQMSNAGLGPAIGRVRPRSYTISFRGGPVERRSPRTDTCWYSPRRTGRRGTYACRHVPFVGMGSLTQVPCDQKQTSPTRLYTSRHDHIFIYVVIVLYCMTMFTSTYKYGLEINNHNQGWGKKITDQ